MVWVQPLPHDGACPKCGGAVVLSAKPAKLYPYLGQAEVNLRLEQPCLDAQVTAMDWHGGGSPEFEAASKDTTIPRGTAARASSASSPAA